MAIRIKVAETARELDDVYRLRYRVYVEEEGRFQHAKQGGSGRIVDEFDSFPGVFNLIAYAGERPVATLRINVEQEDEGLPPDRYVDGRAIREQVIRAAGGARRVFVSAGMLAITTGWRKRRDVFRSLFKMAAGLGKVQGGTDVIVTAKADSAGLYRRLGFRAVGTRLWIEEIGDHIVPMVCDGDDFCNWAFRHFDPENEDLLRYYLESRQRLVLSAGEKVFGEGEAADAAYIVDEGVVQICREGVPGRSGCTEGLTLVSLESGELFGELALIDSAPRSASAYALTNTELVVLAKEDFRQRLEQDLEQNRVLLRILAERLRRMDELALVFAHGTDEERIDYILDGLRRYASEDPRHPGWTRVNVGIEEVARMAGVKPEVARVCIERKAAAGELEIGVDRLRFPRRAWLPQVLRSG
ncbi:MAG: hypothetical protein D6721_03760 [Gammaproteobacteria bacterium]|nr:MAG: hypothetical protein D6721_03760 [Gammaproteobacteria bacterium]